MLTRKNLQLLHAVRHSLLQYTVTPGKYLLIICAAVQICVGGWWLIRNIQKIPQYGDTTEYIQLSKTLKMDTVRVVGYPLVIRLASLCSYQHFALVVYLFQLSVFSGAMLYFFSVLFSWQELHFRNNIGTHHKFFCYVIGTLVMLTNPILLHFHLSILSDSFALSFTLLFLTALFAYLYTSAVGIAPGIVLAGSFVCSSLMRAEKRFFSLAVVGIILVFWFWQQRERTNLRFLLKKGGVLLLILILMNGMITMVNHKTQTADMGRVPFSYVLPYSVFATVVWQRLASVYPDLPPDIRQRFSYQDAVTFDRTSHLPLRQVLLPKIRQANWDDTLAILNRITAITFQRYWQEILWRIGKHFAAYLLSPFAFAYEIITNGSGGVRAWTISRMAMASPLLTTVFLWIGIVMLFLQTVLGVISCSSFIKRIVCPFLPLLIGSVLNSASFSLGTPQYWHIRYALISYATILLFLSAVNMFGFLSRPHIRS